MFGRPGMRCAHACAPFPTEPDKGRTVVERSYASFKQRRGLATGSDKLAVVFRGAATVRSILRWLRSPSGDTPWATSPATTPGSSSFLPAGRR